MYAMNIKTVISVHGSLVWHLDVCIDITYVHIIPTIVIILIKDHNHCAKVYYRVSGAYMRP